jgi:transposase
MKIAAIDLGKFQSVACLYESSSGEHSFTSVSTKPSDIHDLLATHRPQRVVIEIGSAAGWINDLAVTMEIPIEVANPNHEAWRWKNVKRKTDKDDALKLARLSAMNQLPTPTLPSAEVRQWRSLIGYRTTLVARRTAIKNHIRSLLDRQGIRWPGGRSGWTDKSIAALKLMARLATGTRSEALWRFELQMELESMAQL